MKRKIEYASFAEAVIAPGILGADKTLDIHSKPGIEMELEPGLLLVTYKEREVLIPLANVKSLVVVQDKQPLK